MRDIEEEERNDMTEAKRDFWNQRAKMGFTAGTNDFMLKKLELDLILARVAAGSSVLDVGCGNGDTMIELARQKKCSGVGLDFAEEMVAEAEKASTTAGFADKLKFIKGRLPDLPEGLGEFDFVISERCLINLDSEADQHRAFKNIIRHVRPGGVFMMIECSTEGLDRINEIRGSLGLELMTVPWHNVFFKEASVEKWGGKDAVLEEKNPFASTYYFLSRIVYARLAADRGEELKYDSDINKLSLRLPVLGNFGAARLWMWRRK